MDMGRGQPTTHAQYICHYYPFVGVASLVSDVSLVCLHQTHQKADVVVPTVRAGEREVGKRCRRHGERRADWGTGPAREPSCENRRPAGCTRTTNSKTSPQSTTRYGSAVPLSLHTVRGFAAAAAQRGTDVDCAWPDSYCTERYHFCSLVCVCLVVL